MPVGLHSRLQLQGEIERETAVTAHVQRKFKLLPLGLYRFGANQGHEIDLMKGKSHEHEGQGQCITAFGSWDLLLLPHLSIFAELVLW